RSRPRRAAAARGAARAPEPAAGHVVQRPAALSAERRSELRVGFTARRAVVLAAVMCVLTLTLAGPVRTFFAQHAEMKQQSQIDAALRKDIADLQQQKANLADPAHIKAQARERLGFVMPGEIPFQVQLPPGAEVPGGPGVEAAPTAGDDPWYTALWHTIADAPHGLPPTEPLEPPR
ncbi:septum formation initiator family protein, partial [Mycobacterium sp. M1]